MRETDFVSSIGRVVAIIFGLTLWGLAPHISDLSGPITAGDMQLAFGTLLVILGLIG